ncbi:unnamed protein product [Mytilus coruscus]|uniref:Uncharacterized protein n=1 Tax=Mytilus coruscus TaxID=42192 RepID=A0A6J8CYT2_MYTCO|nr:unnamed protein product [Mytilus coruscus]
MASRTHVEVSILEQTLILQGYCRNRCNWPAVMEHMKQNLDKLTAAARDLYQDGAFTKLRRGMGDQVKKMTKDNVIYSSEELKELAAEIRVAEARYSTKGTPAQRKEIAKRVVADQAPGQPNHADDEFVLPPINNIVAVPVVQPVAQVVHPVAQVVKPVAQVVQPVAQVVQPVAQVAQPIAAVDHRAQAIPIAEDEEEVQNPTPPKKLRTSEVARQAYEEYMKSIERSQKLEAKLHKCMDKFLNSD